MSNSRDTNLRWLYCDSWIQDVQTALDYFSQYSSIWEKDREAELQEFMKLESDLFDFEERMCYYEQLEEQFMTELQRRDFGPVAVYTGNWLT